MVAQVVEIDGPNAVRWIRSVGSEQVPASASQTRGGRHADAGYQSRVGPRLAHARDFPIDTGDAIPAVRYATLAWSPKKQAARRRPVQV